jgi:hypothetical protein
MDLCSTVHACGVTKYETMQSLESRSYKISMIILAELSSSCVCCLAQLVFSILRGGRNMAGKSGQLPEFSDSLSSRMKGDK